MISGFSSTRRQSSNQMTKTQVQVSTLGLGNVGTISSTDALTHEELVAENNVETFPAVLPNQTCLQHGRAVQLI